MTLQPNIVSYINLDPKNLLMDSASHWMTSQGSAAVESPLEREEAVILADLLKMAESGEAH